MAHCGQGLVETEVKYTVSFHKLMMSWRLCREELIDFLSSRERGNHSIFCARQGAIAAGKSNGGRKVFPLSQGDSQTGGKGITCARSVDDVDRDSVEFRNPTCVDQDHPRFAQCYDHRNTKFLLQLASEFSSGSVVVWR